tara:strand:- start:2561 stop:2932 length:372 start_codon:yes stop_codon:yes gene_type:complete
MKNLGVKKLFFRIKFCHLLLVMIFVSCDIKNDVPNDIMSKEEMINFLFDINMINSSRGFKNDLGYNYFLINDSMLYNKHKIDCLKFYKSNKYYTKNPNMYIEIYDGVDKKIKMIRDSLNDVIN